MKNKAIRLLACLLCAVLLASCMPLPASAAVAGFTDIPSGVWYANAVRDLVSRGVMSGKSSSRFEPSGSLTRAEFATMLARSALPEEELAKYKYRGPFSDVKRDHWANHYINWASENGIVSGTGGGKFSPGNKITRQDMAVMLVNYSKAMGITLKAVTSVSFPDSGSIKSYARSSVDACARAGVLTGDKSGFRPLDTSKRSEAAQMFYTFLKVGQPAKYTVIRRKVGSTSVAAVEFDPGIYTPNVVMGGSRITGMESMDSLVSRSGAEIAVNGAFFDLGTYEPYATVIKSGELLTNFDLYSPAKSAIVMDGSGRFSVENFTTRITLTANNPDGSVKEAKGVVVNRISGSPKDGTRIIYTRAWGNTLGFAPKYAARVDGSGYVTDVYTDEDVAIPEGGYLIVQRGDRQYQNDFIQSITVGTYMQKTVEYDGASTQDIELCLGVGPKLVENGSAYGSSETYKAEGLDQIGNFGDAARVCIGIKPDGRLIILSAYTSLPDLSNIMVSLGCRSAVNLDGGGSANLYAGGTYFAGPTGRLLNNVLTFRPK